MKKIIFSSLIFFLLFVNISSAQYIAATNSTGQVKTTFYANETVYVTSFGNISSNSSEVWVYIVSDSNSWSAGTNLTDVTTGRKSFFTDSNGNLSISVVWFPTLKVGQYDIVVDVGRDGVYNTTDFVDNTSAAGFEVIATPAPTLTASLGSRTPADHKFNISSGILDNIVMQIKLVAGGLSGSAERVKLSSMDLVSNGTGNEKTGISMVKLIYDINNNLTIDSEDPLIAYGKFMSDNGFLTMSVTGNKKLIMNLSSDHYLLVDYVMSTNNYDDSTYQLQVISINGIGEDSGLAAKTTGLPLYSTVTTISGAVNIIPACADNKNQTSCSSNCQWCSIDNSCKNPTEACVACNGTISLGVKQYQANSVAITTGLSGCDNKIIYLKENSCAGTDTGICAVNGTGCSINFTTPSAGSHTYYACLDKNNNQSFETEEQTSAVLLATSQWASSGSSDYLIWIIVIIVIVVIISAAFLLWKRGKAKPKEIVYQFKPEENPSV